MKHIHAIALFLLACAPALAQQAEVTITNPTNTQRYEVVEIDLAALKGHVDTGKALVVRNVAGQELTSQLTHDGKLLVHAAVRPQGTAKLYVSNGTPHPATWTTTGAQYPQRLDDLAWENDLCAYRVYGPALQRTGERSFGTDVWVKNTPDTLVSTRYALDRQGISYHQDHGNGLDPYRVGATLGLGAPALMIADSLILPYCYRDFAILDNGPLRFTVSLTYNPTDIGGDHGVVEHRIISLDEGSHFNKMTVWYDGLRHATNFATGFPIHQEDTLTYTLGQDFIAYADPTDDPLRNNCQLYVAALFPSTAVHTLLQPFSHPHDGATGHALGILPHIGDKQRVTYYFGAAWSNYDVRTYEEWLLVIQNHMKSLSQPLIVTVSPSTSR